MGAFGDDVGLEVGPARQDNGDALVAELPAEGDHLLPRPQEGDVADVIDGRRLVPVQHGRDPELLPPVGDQVQPPVVADAGADELQAGVGAPGVAADDVRRQVPPLDDPVVAGFPDPRAGPAQGGTAGEVEHAVLVSVVEGFAGEGGLGGEGEAEEEA